MICLCISTKKHTQAIMTTATRTRTKKTTATPETKKQRRLEHIDVVNEVLGETKKSGKHKYPQSTFRLDSETRQKLEEMTEKLNANQVDVVTFALKQVYSLFEDEKTINRIHAVIERKLQRKNKD